MFPLCWVRCSIKMEIPSLGRLVDSSRTVVCFLFFVKQSGKFLFERALNLPQGPIFTIHLPAHGSRDDLTNLPRPSSHALIYYSRLIGRLRSIRQRRLLTGPLIPVLFGRIIRKATELLPAKSTAVFIQPIFLPNCG